MHRSISAAFCLLAMSGTGHPLAQARVPDSAVEILDVGIVPGELSDGDRAKLSWSTRYAVSCAFDPPLQGIDSFI